MLEAAVESLDGEERELLAKVVEIYERHGFKAPRPEDVAEALGVTLAAIERLVDYLCDRGKLFRLAKNVVLSDAWLRKAQDLVVSIIEKKGSLDSADFKYHLGSTRKYALAILDFLDARHVTVRNANVRTLAASYRENLL